MSALKLGRIWASAPASPNRDPGDAKYSLGWVAEIPVFQTLNYINNRYDTNIVSLAERGVFEWGGDVTYKNAAITWDEVDGFVYFSKTANPSTTIRPGLNTPQWEKSAVQISRAQYDLAVANWSNHIANTSNPHNLTTEILVTYSKSVIDSKVAVIQADINAHESNYLNPHEVTATQAGAVPVAGGSYTGLVKHLFASIGIGPTSYAASLLTDATGTFLALGANAKLGLDSSKKAVFIDDTAVKSNLLIASEYITAREAVEASYVPPTPDCMIQFRNSLALKYGSGLVSFTGPAGSRGYVDKSGTTSTAALDTPRYTKDGLLIDTTESMLAPLSLNGLNADNFTLALEFKSILTGACIFCTWYTGGTPTPNGGIFSSTTQYYFRSTIGGVQVGYNLGVIDHTKSHKVVVVSDATANKTYVYFDGELKATVTGKQDYLSRDYYYFSTTSAPYGSKYLINFKVWLSALSSRQMLNI